MSNSLWPHGLQQARLPCPSLSDSCPLEWWWYLTISSSVAPFIFCLQSFPASGSFLMSWLYIRWPKYWSFSFSISPSNEYSGLISFRMDWFDLFSDQGTLAFCGWLGFLPVSSVSESFPWLCDAGALCLSHPSPLWLLTASFFPHGVTFS